MTLLRGKDKSISCEGLDITVSGTNKREGQQQANRRHLVSKLWGSVSTPLFLIHRGSAGQK